MVPDLPVVDLDQYNNNFYIKRQTDPNLPVVDLDQYNNNFYIKRQTDPNGKYMKK